MKVIRCRDVGVFMATEHITFVAGDQVLREFGVKGNATFCNLLECVALWGTDLTK